MNSEQVVKSRANRSYHGGSCLTPSIIRADQQSLSQFTVCFGEFVFPHPLQRSRAIVGEKNNLCPFLQGSWLHVLLILCASTTLQFTQPCLQRGKNQNSYFLLFHFSIKEDFWHYKCTAHTYFTNLKLHQFINWLSKFTLCVYPYLYTCINITLVYVSTYCGHCVWLTHEVFKKGSESDTSS